VAVSLTIFSMFGYGTARPGSATLYGCRSWYVDSVVVYIHPAIAINDSGNEDHQNFCTSLLGSGIEQPGLREGQNIWYTTESVVVTSMVKVVAIITNYEDCSGIIEIYDDNYIYYTGQIALKRGINVIVVEYYIHDTVCAYVNVQELIRQMSTPH